MSVTFLKYLDSPTPYLISIGRMTFVQKPSTDKYLERI